MKRIERMQQQPIIAAESGYFLTDKEFDNLTDALVCCLPISDGEIKAVDAVAEMLKPFVDLYKEQAAAAEKNNAHSEREIKLV